MSFIQPHVFQRFKNDYSMNQILSEGNVAILPRSGAIFEKVMLSDDTSHNPRDSQYDRFTDINPYIENPIYRGEIMIHNSSGGYDIIIPDGPDNLFPYRWKMLVEQDSILPGMLRQKLNLLLAGGIHIYIRKKIGNEVVNEEVIDDQISDWLEFQDINKYISQQAMDWVYLERNANLMIPNMASRFSIPEIRKKAGFAAVIRIPIEEVRMCKAPDFSYDVEDYYISDWTSWHSDAVKYPAFKKTDPLGKKSVLYSLMPSFCSKYYGRPSTIGVANYLSLKILLLNNTRDSVINAPFRYHIESPLEYWTQIQQAEGWSSEQLKEYEEDFLTKIDDFLRSDTGENAMKRFHSKFTLSEYGKERLGWSIKLIEDDSEKRIKSNFDVFQKINEHIIAASSLDPAISNINIQGKLSSGLDKLTAFNIHMLINTPMPRQKILAAMNEAIKVNFWTENYRPFIGFKEIQLSTTDKSAKDTPKSDSNEDDNNE